MTKSFFFLVVGTFFSVASILHFLRLMFEWRIFIGSWEFPTWISGLIFVFGVFMVYWSIKLKNGSNESKSEDRNEDL